MKKTNKVTEEIVFACICGDEKSFTIIYNHYYNRIYFMAKQYFRDDTKAEDIAQDTFVQVYKNIKHLKVPKAFHTWLLKIAYNQCMSHLNANKVKFISDYCMFDIENISNEKEVDVLKDFEKQQLYDTISKRLESMSDDFKSVGYLRFYEELSIKEISNILNIPEGTVKSRLYNVRTLLAKSLEKKNISPRTFRSYSVSSLTITAAYNLLSKSYQVTAPNPALIIKQASKGFFIIGSRWLPIQKMIASSVAISCICGVITLYILNQNEYVPSYASEIVSDKISNTEVKEAAKQEALAKITNINYGSLYTNQPILIDIETTNDNYDTFYVNEKPIKYIYQNGVYTISLIKDANVIDTKEIEIDSIDLNAPELLDIHNNDRVYTVYLSDGHSGINQTTIRYIRNEQVSNQFSYDEQSQTITFVCDLNTINKFNVSDFAGNVREVEVISQTK